MKFHLGKPIETPGFPPDASWHRARASGPVALQVQAVFVGLLVAGFMGAVWNYGTSARDSGTLPWGIPQSTWLLFFLMVVPGHELLHTLAHPGFGFGPRSYLGFWPAKLLPYAQYTGPLSRGRNGIMLLLPFMVLTVLPTWVAILLADNHSYFTIYWFDRFTATLAVFSVLNAAISSGDLLMAFSNWRNVPAQAQLQGSGWDLYYKVPASSPQSAIKITP